MRNATGFSLIETLVATCVMSFISALMLGLILVNGKANGKITSVQETSDSVRAINERLGKDIREGRSLGDVYGLQVSQGASKINYGSDCFPSLASNTNSKDPIYGGGQAPPKGWPSSWPAPPWQLNNQTLIVQLPILDSHNDQGGTHGLASNYFSFPTAIQSGQGNPAVASGQNVDNVETHVYMVVADPAHPGVAGDPNNPPEFLLQYAAFPGYPISGTNSAGAQFRYDPTAHQVGPVTIVSGIVGPLDSATHLPKVFQFIDKTDSTGAPRDSILPATTPSGQYVSNYTGIVVNLELRKHQITNTQRRDISIIPVGFKTEIFLRNNAQATAVGTPQAVW